jgi:RNA-binding protein
VLNSGLKRELKARAHSLKPVVIIGQKGITPAVVASISEALDVHELIKVRLPVSEKVAQVARIAELATELTADVVGSIGRVLILYRPRPD